MASWFASKSPRGKGGPEEQVALLTQRLEEQQRKHAQDLKRLSEEAQELKARLQKALTHRTRSGATDVMKESGADPAFVRQVEWRLKNYSTKVRTVPKNQGLWSEKFSIMGAVDMYLEFFPQGRDSTAHPNFCALFLWCPAGVRLRYRLRVGNHTAVDDDVFDNRMGHGHSNFCDLQAQVDTKTDSVSIGLDIIEMSFTQEPSSGLRLVNRGPEHAVSREAAVLQNRNMDTVEWRIRDVLRRVREVPTGAFICSPLFSIAGVRDMQLEFYPNGLEGGRAGYCGFYVRCPSGKYTLSITLFVGTAKKGPSKTEFDKSAAKGLPEFCRLEEQIAEGEDDLLVGVMVLNPLLEEEEVERTLFLGGSSS